MGLQMPSSFFPTRRILMVPRTRLPSLLKVDTQCHHHESIHIEIPFHQLTPRLLLRRHLWDESSDNNKRSRVELSKRRVSSPSGGKRTPITPYRPQPASRSPEMRDHFPTSPLQVVLPPHPKPMGISPPIATLSPPSSAPSPTNPSERDDKMHVDARSLSPPTTRGSKTLDGVNGGSSSRSPSTRQAQSRSPPVDKESSS
jgi:hypothetical protein